MAAVPGRRALTVQDRVEAALQRAGIAGPIVSLAQVAPVVSPMCRAADWTGLAVRTADAACFVKLRSADAADFVTVADAAAGAGLAAGLGVTPALRSAQPDAGAMVFDLLAPPWREARLGDLANQTVLAAVLDAKRRLHRGPALARCWDVFAQIERLAEALPANLAPLLHAVADIADAFTAAGQDSVPSHNDGHASNVMVHPDGSVRLVDFDCAGMADPHYDIGVVLNEICSTDAEWQAAIEAAFGTVTPSDLARCRAYAIADDLFWGLWGLSRHAQTTRTGLEFLKYGTWRLLRCRMALRRPDHAVQLRRL